MEGEVVACDASMQVGGATMRAIKKGFYENGWSSLHWRYETAIDKFVLRGIPPEGYPPKMNASSGTSPIEGS